MYDPDPDTTPTVVATADLGAQEEAIAAPGSRNSPAGAATPLDRIKGRLEELRQERHTEIDIPGYGGELVVRYRPVKWEALREIARRVEQSKSPRRELDGQASTLIDACQEVLIRVDGKLEPIDPAEVHPVRFDQRLAALLDFEAESAREVLYGTFNNDLAVVTVHNELAEWMADADEEVNETFVGEPRGGPR